MSSLGMRLPWGPPTLSRSPWAGMKKRLRTSTGPTRIGRMTFGKRSLIEWSRPVAGQRGVDGVVGREAASQGDFGDRLLDLVDAVPVVDDGAVRDPPATRSPLHAVDIAAGARAREMTAFTLSLLEGDEVGLGQRPVTVDLDQLVAHEVRVGPRHRAAGDVPRQLGRRGVARAEIDGAVRVEGAEDQVGVPAVDAPAVADDDVVDLLLVGNDPQPRLELGIHALRRRLVLHPRNRQYDSAFSGSMATQVELSGQ